jgi:hypothetical protein
MGKDNGAQPILAARWSGSKNAWSACMCHSARATHRQRDEFDTLVNTRQHRQLSHVRNWLVSQVYFFDQLRQILLQPSSSVRQVLGFKVVVKRGQKRFGWQLGHRIRSKHPQKILLQPIKVTEALMQRPRGPATQRTSGRYRQTIYSVCWFTSGIKHVFV